MIILFYIMLFVLNSTLLITLRLLLFWYWLDKSLPIPLLLALCGFIFGISLKTNIAVWFLFVSPTPN